MLDTEPADNKNPLFVRGLCGYFDTAGVLPKHLRRDEINAVLIEVSYALPLIELKRWHGIEIIPLWIILQV